MNGSAFNTSAFLAVVIALAALPVEVSAASSGWPGLTANRVASKVLVMRTRDKDFIRTPGGFSYW
ncbi:hypothetical protein D3C80_1822030 [compost metagenome]